MVGQPLEFERDGPEPLGPQRGFGAGQGFQSGGISRGMGNGGIARDGLHLIDRGAMGAPREGLLDAAVLVAQRDFQMEHLLASALKPEMPRLDNARMHRTDGHFVDLAAVHAKEIAHGGAGSMVLPHRLEPRMVLGNDAVLFPDFALEQMRLGMRGGQRREGPGERLAAADGQRIARIEGQDGDEPQPVAFGHAEEAAEAFATVQFRAEVVNELGQRPLGHVGPREGGAVGQQGEGSGSVHRVG